MRFTIPTLLLAATSVVLSKPTSKIGVVILTEPETGHKLAPMITETCLKACFFEPVDCPAGMYSKQFGDCYTCCRSGS
ncbi:uncharacterized protein BDR25DRAFT_306124 [Lindgomyces ingoldianus]|uniref:Uncharacterized protein n=1 Tax=Lindgomyces ingoldianus TaxID=673940 RepID=A0ACB6QHA0_9PLEO|nr:uncharacterized protein BDR25DRAFT_306124 [Lindgomyces ingoldianus]KAF2466256.1 hypothetical protein BDR25DRAFT_306124 [Lindgomyces ingoldianus]